MMIIFWDKDGVLLTEYLPRGATINGLSDASIVERLRSVIVEKGGSKDVPSIARIAVSRLPSHVNFLAVVVV